MGEPNGTQSAWLQTFNSDSFIDRREWDLCHVRKEEQKHDAETGISRTGSRGPLGVETLVHKNLASHNTNTN